MYTIFPYKIRRSMHFPEAQTWWGSGAQVQSSARWAAGAPGAVLHCSRVLGCAARPPGPSPSKPVQTCIPRGDAVAEMGCTPHLLCITSPLPGGRAPAKQVHSRPCVPSPPAPACGFGPKDSNDDCFMPHMPLEYAPQEPVSCFTSRICPQGPVS